MPCHDLIRGSSRSCTKTSAGSIAGRHEPHPASHDLLSNRYQRRGIARLRFRLANVRLESVFSHTVTVFNPARSSYQLTTDKPLADRRPLANDWNNYGHQLRASPVNSRLASTHTEAATTSLEIWQTACCLAAIFALFSLALMHESAQTE